MDNQSYVVISCAFCGKGSYVTDSAIQDHLQQCQRAQKSLVEYTSIWSVLTRTLFKHQYEERQSLLRWHSH